MAKSQKPSFSEQLAQAHRRLPHPADWQGDGIDHINVHQNGITDLGRTLHPTSPLVFKHDILGRFYSISAFWDFVETGGRAEKLRFLRHKERREYKKTLPIGKSVRFLNYMVLDALHQRLKHLPKLREELVNSVLPFDCYDVRSGYTASRNLKVFWLVDGLTEIRRAMTLGQEPDLSRWMCGLTRDEIFKAFRLENSNNISLTQEPPQQNALLETLRAEDPLNQRKKKAPALAPAEQAPVRVNRSMPSESPVVAVEQPEVPTSELCETAAEVPVSEPRETMTEAPVSELRETAAETPAESTEPDAAKDERFALKA